MGRIISTGGTTSEPKYKFISNEDCDFGVEQCHFGLQQAGVMPGDVLVNYFPPGNLWCVYDLISSIRGNFTVLNLGRQNSYEYILKVCNDLNPNSIVGIPSHLIELCKQSPKLKFEKVFFTSEPFLPKHRKFLCDVWGVESIRSIGYGSADSGILAYQCKNCDHNEYHPYDGVHIDIDSDENIIAINYQYLKHHHPVLTGDRGQIVNEHNNLPTFRLLGRNDGIILIWGARLSSKVIFDSCEKCVHGYVQSQIRIFSVDGEDCIEIAIESSSQVLLVAHYITDLIWESCSDLWGIMNKKQFSSKVYIKQEHYDNFIRSNRVGKIIPILDVR